MATKSELIKKIKCLEHNLQAQQETNEIQYKNAIKLYDLLIACGYTQRELNEYIMSNKLDSSYLLPPKHKISISEAKKAFGKDLKQCNVCEKSYPSKYISKDGKCANCLISEVANRERI